jgi:hypothetical protein
MLLFAGAAAVELCRYRAEIILGNMKVRERGMMITAIDTNIFLDNLVGAYARSQATRLLWRDRGFYRGLFPALSLYDPAAAC